MGIPHLITFLRPYAELESLNGRSVVVDGPALAYYIFYVCLSRMPDARNPFEVAPSYEDLGRTVTEWLDGLRGSGAAIQKIYFDGFLPPPKLNTRLKRLAAQTTQLIEYYNAHQIPCRLPSATMKQTSTSLFTSPAPRPGVTSLPPVPFLVPAVIETLQNTERYRTITKVVPGEADLYCARYLQKHGGIVFTGDSDLLVHGLGLEGAVSFFKDIEVSSSCNPEVLCSQIFHPAAIANRLGLPTSHGLQALAFEIFIDNQGTFRKLLQQATCLKAVKTHGQMYEDFCKEYDLLMSDQTEGAKDTTRALNILHCLDPRISEFVLQFPSLAKLAGKDRTVKSAKPAALHVFLPFLLDCPVRTSAWEMSAIVRQLSYGLINLIVPKSEQQTSVFEHRRQQKNSSGREWQLPNSSEISEFCMAVMNTLNQLEAKLSKVSRTNLWTAFAIYQEVEWSTSLDRPILGRLCIDQMVNLEGKFHKNCTWDIIQYLAQIQGSYYSFRFLKQITSLVISHDVKDPLPEAINLLHNRLGSLPSFCDTPDLACISSLLQQIESSEIFKVAYEILGIQESKAVEAPSIESETAKNKRKRKGAQARRQALTGQTKPRNPFELLEQE